MEIEYDKQADALYIEFKPGKVARTQEVDKDTFIDYFNDGTVKGIEILAASRRAFSIDDPFVVYLKNLDVKVIKNQ